MSLPPSNDPCWLRLANGGLARLQTQNLAAQLLTKRLSHSRDLAEVKAKQIHDFFVKWERALPREIQQLPYL